MRLFKLKKLLFIFLLLQNKLNSFTIMIDPAGDAKHAGRKLTNSFERGAAFQFAQALQAHLASQSANIAVILTKQPGETVDHLQIANFANSLQVDLFLTINFYEELSVKPNIFIYHYQNQTFFSSQFKDQINFYPYTQAFMFNFEKTQKYALIMQQELSQKAYQHYFHCQTPLAMPFKPLAGLVCPALGIEIGIKRNGWETYLQPLVNSLNRLIWA